MMDNDIRVPPGHGKSWNLGRPFSRPGKENDDIM